MGIEGCFFVKYLGLVNVADKIEEEKSVDQNSKQLFLRSKIIFSWK